MTFEEKVAVLAQPGMDQAIHALLDAAAGNEFGEDITGSDAELAKSDPARFLSDRGVSIPDALNITVTEMTQEEVAAVECVGGCCICGTKGPVKVCA